MLDAAARDFVAYIMHVQVQAVENEADEEPVTTGMATSGPEDPSAGSVLTGARAAAVAAAGQQAAEDTGLERVEANAASKVQTVVRSDEERTPRNAPCPCGSGKKYKHCHGRAA